MANRLIDSLSPYLRQHADNPVDWQPWGQEAFDEAIRRDVPVFISIGYAACHWCHVMAHESFEDPEIGTLLNDRFVCVKVDREEHPGVDAVYMSATQALTGQGGWPMTVFATPKGEPFFCGTYFPPRPVHGSPAFRQVIDAIDDAWRNRRDEIATSAASIASHLQGQVFRSGIDLPTRQELTEAEHSLVAQHDTEHGGFDEPGRAPRFPAHSALLFLIDQVRRSGNPDTLAAITTTCESMAYGGIYDQLAGGFSRYSVDAQWIVPHFEKMLYDNALLLQIYTGAARHSDNPMPLRVAHEIVDFLENDLRTPQGAFASALDADAAGQEGSTYVWDRDELIEVLGPEDGAAAADHFAVTGSPNFEGTRWVLRRQIEPDERELQWRPRLLGARAQRPQPARDDKVVTAWNALAVSGLCQLSEQTGEHTYADIAVRVTDYLLSSVVEDNGVVWRISMDGERGAAPGVLEDYAALASALARVHLTTQRMDYLDRAVTILTHALTEFADPDRLYVDAQAIGGLPVRPGDPLDNPTPSGIGLLAEALVLVGEYAARPDLVEHARTIVRHYGHLVTQAPRAAATWGTVAGLLADGPVTVVIGGPAGSAHDALERAARHSMGAAGLLVSGHSDFTPLLRDRVGDASAVYLCQGARCLPPISAPEEIQKQLQRIMTGD